MNKTEFWAVAMIDDETGEVLQDRENLTLGELGMFLDFWSDERLVMNRASLCFGRVD